MTTDQLPPAWMTNDTPPDDRRAICVACEDAVSTADSPFCPDCRDSEFLSYG